MKIGMATMKKTLDTANEENNVFPKMKFAKGIAKIKLISSPIQEATRLITNAKPIIKMIGFQTFRMAPKARLNALATEDIPFLTAPLVFLFSPKLFFLNPNLNRNQSWLPKSFQFPPQLFFQYLTH